MKRNMWTIILGFGLPLVLCAQPSQPTPARTSSSDSAPPPASSVISRPPPASAPQPKSSAAPGGALSSLSHDQIAIGLKQALTNGVQAAIRELGHDGGFLTNLNFRIPLPKQLHTVEQTLRAVKQEKLADEFVAAM